MERDVRATEQPVTQRFCANNTSCSPWWQLTEQPHTQAHGHAHMRVHGANVARPGEWQKLCLLDCVADETQDQRSLQL